MMCWGRQTPGWSSAGVKCVQLPACQKHTTECSRDCMRCTLEAGIQKVRPQGVIALQGDSVTAAAAGVPDARDTPTTCSVAVTVTVAWFRPEP
jgi:hypothetical protein